MIFLVDLAKIIIVWPYNLSSNLKLKGGGINKYVVITGINHIVLATKLCQLPYWPLACLTSSLRQKNIKTILHAFDFLGGFLNVNVSEVSFDEIHQLFSKDLDIEPGGHWRPKDCKPRWKVRSIFSQIMWRYCAFGESVLHWEHAVKYL